MQRIELLFTVEELTSYSVTRLRTRSQYFVDVLQGNAGKSNKQSLLKQLRVKLNGVASEIGPEREYSWPVGAMSQVMLRKGCSPHEYYMFALEPLVSLRGVEDIEIHGVTAWFKECLEMCIRGEGGKVETADWPTKMVKRKEQRGTKKRKISVEVTTRERWQPTFDWRMFAARNNILLPGNIDRFLPAV